jgi:hypothetical protein
MPNFHCQRAVPAIVLALLLAGCGGGDDNAAATPPPVVPPEVTPPVPTSPLVITASNALAVAADAADVVLGSGPDAMQGLLAGAEGLLQVVPGAALVPMTAGCPAGGTVSGAPATNMAGATTLVATACQLAAGGPVYAGSATILVGSPVIDTSTNNRSQTTNVSAQGFSITQAGTVTSFTGDLQALDASTSRVSGVTLSGTSLAYVRTSGTNQRAATLKNYSRARAQPLSGPAFVTMSAGVETKNSLLGPGVTSYQLSTPLPFTDSAGSVAVAGSGSSLLAATQLVDPITLVRTWNVTADTNGDGVDDFSTSNVTLGP